MKSTNPSPQPAVLICDAGTSRLKLAYFQDEVIKATIAVERRPLAKATQSIAQWLSSLTPVSACVLASGRSADLPELQAFLETIAGAPCKLLTSTSPVPFKSSYAPGQAGVDRLANLTAAYRRHTFPAIIVDAGTAITVEVLDTNGAFSGGSILPGPSLQALALHSGTTSLPHVTTESDVPAIATSTARAIESGIVHGCAGGVQRIISLVQLETGPATVTITGGWGRELSQILNNAYPYDPHWTLKGIFHMHQFSEEQVDKIPGTVLS